MLIDIFANVLIDIFANMGNQLKNINASAIIFDDHRLFADSFSSLIERLELFQSVHAFHSEPELRHFFIRNTHLRVYLFLDYYLKDKNALSVINEVKRLNKRVSFIVVSSVTNPITIANILTYNPDGFISKSSGFDILVQCIKAINGGNVYRCPVIEQIIATTAVVENISFTAREIEILQYFALGFSITETADRLHLSKHTVVAHRRNMMSKAQVNSIIELLTYARNYDLI